MNHTLAPRLIILILGFSGFLFRNLKPDGVVLLNVTEVVFTSYGSVSAAFILLHKVSHFKYLSVLTKTSGSYGLLNVTEVIFTGYRCVSVAFILLHKVSHFKYLSVC